MESKNYKYYPDITDEDFQNSIYEKREYYGNKIRSNNRNLSKYEDIKEFRDSICGGDFKLYTHQSFLSNFINPHTPYTGLLIFHGVGTGKTGSAISIAENFKDNVIKYGNKIHILIPGPLIKKNWKSEIIKFNNKNYYNNILNEKGIINNKDDIEKELWSINSQFYKLMSYRSFYKKVLGEKIKDLSLDKKKVRKVDGKIEREIPIDRLESLDNTLLIVDEAHNLTNNDYGNALKTLIRNSKNLKVILLSATPMKNLAVDIVELINFIRPPDDPIQKDKIFNNPKYGYLLELKENGIEYLKKKTNGYVSYYRGAHPLLFAKQVDMGEIPKDLKFTKVIRCILNKFQLETYNIVQSNLDDSLEKSSEAVANFVLPGLNEKNDNLIGLHGTDGNKKLKLQLENNSDTLLKLINKKLFNNKIQNIENILFFDDYTDNFKGLIFKQPYLKNFSIKFDKCLENLNNLVDGKSGAKTAFIYSNLVKSGVELFTEVLIQNGYLEYREDGNYEIYDDTIDYFTGKTYKNFKESEKKREFKPAVFIKITGQVSDNEINEIEEKKNIIDNVFNSINNVEGKNLKFILGSKVMNEGITLENTGEIHILDVHYNLGKTYQVIGRGIRQCKHYNITNENNPFPEVKIYKYVISLEDKISSEELLYKKAEMKYLLVKKIERILKKNSIDCPINYEGNIFKEEYEKNKNCEEPNMLKKQNLNNLCPDICDFMKCIYECSDKKLNTKYYNKNSKLYNLIEKKNLDYSTFTLDFIKNEINLVKELIKKLFKIKYVYTIEEIISEVKNQIKKNQSLFDNFFVYQSLNQLIPETENDFNNFNDIIYDKYNRLGYLIYINKFYIYQPFNLNEQLPIYYRTIYETKFSSNIGLSNFIKKDANYLNLKNKLINKDKNIKYNFNTYSYYYDNREENNYVGIIDQSNYSKDELKSSKDVFKIRSKKKKNLDKKRGTGIPSSKGAVCGTAKDKKELIKICKELNINDKILKNKNRDDICNIIRDYLFFNEKYNTDKEKKTYMIIPSNHPQFKFPLNLEDRILFLNEELNKSLNDKIKFTISKEKGGIYKGIRDNKYVKYIITFINKSYYDSKSILKYGFTLKDGKWKIIVE